MTQRETAVSKSVEYEVAGCTNCGEKVFVDTDIDNVDRLPEGVPVVVTGGNNMTVDTTGFSASSKNYRVPEVLIKLFGLESTDNVEQSYLCPACAYSVYGFGSD